MKEATYVKLELPSLNRSGDLRYHLSSTYNEVLPSLNLTIYTFSHVNQRINTKDGINNLSTSEEGGFTSSTLYYVLGQATSTPASLNLLTHEAPLKYIFQAQGTPAKNSYNYNSWYIVRLS